LADNKGLQPLVGDPLLVPEALMRNTLLYLFVALGFLAALSSCASGGRIYSSDPLPQKETSLVVLGAGCSVAELGKANDPDFFYGLRSLGSRSFIELLPGDYTLAINYVNFGAYAITYAKEYYDMKLSALPGHVYYIYAEQPSQGAWRPKLADCASYGDYLRLKDGKKLHEQVMKYFEGERAVIKNKEGK
jgi:hypothetical protein